MKASKPWEQRGYFPRKGNAINLTEVIIVIIVLHVSVIIIIIVIIITKGNAIHLTNVVISGGEISRSESFTNYHEFAKYVMNAVSKKLFSGTDNCFWCGQKQQKEMYSRAWTTGDLLRVKYRVGLGWQTEGEHWRGVGG